MAGLGGNWRKELPKLLEKFGELSQQKFQKKMNRRLGVQGLQLVKQGFRSGTAPDGAAWKPTLRGGRPLRDTGRLGNSFTLQMTNSGFVIGTNVPYAPTHQFGAKITAKGQWLTFKVGKQWAKKKSVVVVARPMLPQGRGLPAKWNDTFEAIVNGALRQWYSGA